MRRKLVLRISLVLCTCLVAAFATAVLTHGQRRGAPAKSAAPKPAPSPTPTPEPDQQDVDTEKITTDLVTVPVIVTTREGHYISDLSREEFGVSENGVKQEVAFFGTISAPFHVVLMLDNQRQHQRKDRLDPRGCDQFRRSIGERRPREGNFV